MSGLPDVIRVDRFQNVEAVLKKLYSSPDLFEEILDSMQVFIPGFDNIKLEFDSLAKVVYLFVTEDSRQQVTLLDALSTGTKNLLKIVTSLLQSEHRQFLCFDQPELSLHPQMVRELVFIFREYCKEGNIVWLNTHSQTIMAELHPDEVVLVDKIEGQTKLTQLKGRDFYGLAFDDALLSNYLKGGRQW